MESSFSIYILIYVHILLQFYVFIIIFSQSHWIGQFDCPYTSCDWNGMLKKITFVYEVEVGVILNAKIKISD